MKKKLAIVLMIAVLTVLAAAAVRPAVPICPAWMCSCRKKPER